MIYLLEGFGGAIRFDCLANGDDLGSEPPNFRLAFWTEDLRHGEQLEVAVFIDGVELAEKVGREVDDAFVEFQSGGRIAQGQFVPTTFGGQRLATALAVPLIASGHAGNAAWARMVNRLRAGALAQPGLNRHAAQKAADNARHEIRPKIGQAAQQGGFLELLNENLPQALVINAVEAQDHNLQRQFLEFTMLEAASEQFNL